MKKIKPHHSAWPDLQAMVEKFGGYDRIPQEAWDEHDRCFKALRERLNREHNGGERPK
jgi:hypothetical protein